MRCRKCKAEIPDGAKFCCACGVKQDMAHRPKSRGNGQGSVYQLKNKTWIAIITEKRYTTPGGEPRRVTRSKSGFKTKKEALDYLPVLRITPQEEKRKPKTWAEIYDLWEPTHGAGKSTMDCYRAARKYFAPLEDEYMADITIDDLQECMDDCPKGKRTQENMKALAGLLYKYAIPRHQADLNMGQYLRIHADGGTGKDGLPLDALEKIEAAAGSVPGADYVLCQCYLGFRPSEFLALDAKHYNRLEKAFTGGAKTDAGKDRVVTVSPKIQPIIDRLTRDRISGPVFCAPDGGHMTIGAYRKLFYDVLDACGIENPTENRDGVKYRKYTPHSCRHTFATLMKRVAGSDKDKLALMGHTSVEMLRHYQDVDYEDLRKITNAL